MLGEKKTIFFFVLNMILVIQCEIPVFDLINKYYLVVSCNENQLFNTNGRLVFIFINNKNADYTLYKLNHDLIVHFKI